MSNYYSSQYERKAKRLNIFIIVLALALIAIVVVGNNNSPKVDNCEALGGVRVGSSYDCWKDGGYIKVD